MSENFRPKSDAERKAQMDRASHAIGADVRPPSVGDRELLRMTEKELQARFAKRLGLYKDALRHPDVSQDQRERMRTWVMAANSLDEYMAFHEEDLLEDKTLTDDQFLVMQDIQEFLERGGMSGYVRLPTGSGKTVVFVELAEAMNLRTLVVVPTKDLLTQTEERFAKFAPGLGLGKVYSGGKDYDQQVTVTTYPSFVQGVIRGTIRPEDYGLLLLDEVHESLTPERVKAVNAFENAIKIGFTATPKYHEEKMVSNLLPEEIHRLRIREAVDKEMICSFSVLIAKTSIDVSSVNIVGGDYPEKELERLLNTAARNVAAVRLYKELSARGKKGAIFSCLSVRHAYEMAKLLNEAGVPAGTMEGEMSDDERKKVTKALDEGKLEVLCGKDLLIRGFDNQKVRYSFNMRPTGSPVLAEQRGGRVLRKPRQVPPGYTKHALIIEFVDGKGLKDQVLFSEVAGAAEMYPPASSEGEERGRGEGGREAFDLQIPGLEVVTDIEEVMRVTRGIKEAFEGHVAEVTEDGLYVVDGKLYGSLEQLAAGHALPFARLLSVLASLGKEPKDLATIPVKTDAGVKRLYSKEEVDGYLELVPEVLPKIRARLEDKGEVMYEGAIWATAEVFAREFGLKSPRDWYRLIDAACEAAKQTIESIKGSNVSEILASYQSRKEPVVRRKVLRTDMVSFWPKERTLSLVRDHLAQRKSKPVPSEADKQAALERKETVERGWLVEGGKPYVGMQWLKSTELFKGQSEDVIERIMINLTQRLQSKNMLKEFIQVDLKTKFVLLSRVIWFLELRRANVFGTENKEKYAEWIDALKAKTFEGAE